MPGLKRLMKKSQIIRLLPCILLATFAVAFVGSIVGVPDDVKRVEEWLAAIEEESYEDGQLVAASELDRRLEQGGFVHSDEPMAAGDYPPVPSVGGFVLNAIRWLPATFSISLLASMVLLGVDKWHGLLPVPPAIALYPVLGGMLVAWVGAAALCNFALSPLSARLPWRRRAPSR